VELAEKIGKEKIMQKLIVSKSLVKVIMFVWSQTHK